MKCDIWVVFETLWRQLKFLWNLTRITFTLPDYVYTFLIARWILLGMRNVADKGCTENQNTHFVFSKFFFFGPKIVPFVRMWENAVAPNRRQYYMAHAWKLAATHTIFNIYWFYTATVVTWTCLIVTSHVRCLFHRVFLEIPQKTGIMSDRVNKRAAKDNLTIRCP